MTAGAMAMQDRSARCHPAPWWLRVWGHPPKVPVKLVPVFTVAELAALDKPNRTICSCACHINRWSSFAPSRRYARPGARNGVEPLIAFVRADIRVNA